VLFAQDEDELSEIVRALSSYQGVYVYRRERLEPDSKQHE
jgi:hypothetical protein